MKKIFDIQKIEDSHLFYLVEQESDIEKLEFLDLSTKVLENIKKQLKKEENKMNVYFLGNEHFESIFVYTIWTKNKKDIVTLLGKEFPKLPKNMTIFTNTSQNLKNLMKTSILSRYHFDAYKSEKEVDEYHFLVEKDQEAIFDSTKKLIEHIVFARDLGTQPSNVIYPESFVELAKQQDFKNTSIKVLDFNDIQEQKLGLLEAVGKGSEKKPRLLILEKITNPENPTIALVGKWVTFDTGGIQVKPWNVMYEMKGDMCGGANTLTLAKLLDEETLNVNIVYAIPLAENHIANNAYKPSDIFTSYSWKTVDIIHTDAEGRLILADAISYVSKNYKLEKIITMATLTGACMVALGFRYAGIMGDDEELINKFLDYSQTHFEKYNRLPFDEYMVEKTKSEVADLQNLTKEALAGSSMAWAFLSNFRMNDEKYTHIDIAGVALNSYEAHGYANRGMTGFWVESIADIVKGM